MFIVYSPQFLLRYIPPLTTQDLKAPTKHNQKIRPGTKTKIYKRNKDKNKMRKPTKQPVLNISDSEFSNTVTE